MCFQLPPLLAVTLSTLSVRLLLLQPSTCERAFILLQPVVGSKPGGLGRRKILNIHSMLLFRFVLFLRNLKHHIVTYFLRDTNTTQCSAGVVHNVSLTRCDKVLFLSLFLFFSFVFQACTTLAVPVFLGSKPNFADSRIILTEQLLPPPFFVSCQTASGKH